MNARTNYIVLLLGLILILAQSGCVRHFGNEPLLNQQPKTYFWLFPDSTIAGGISKQHLHWWGEDKDGYVVGYLMAFGSDLAAIPNPDTLTYGYTTVTDSVLQFPLRTASAKMLMVIRAVDNSFNIRFSRGDVVRLTPSPYWDKNKNGVFDSSDVLLPGLVDAMDQVAARQRFPLKNSVPTVSFVRDPFNLTANILPPDTTFTVATFVWQGSDPDGDETIDSYMLALNDTSGSGTWLTIPAGSANASAAMGLTSAQAIVSLMVPRTRSDVASTEVTADVYGGVYPSLRYLGQLPHLRLDAPNKLFVRVRDVAGGLSAIMAQPSAIKSWFVKRPVSRLLVISDYIKDDSTDVARFYRARFAEFGGGALANYSTLNVRQGTSTVPPNVLLNPMFMYTLRLFDFVFWYTDAIPSLTLAQSSLFYYSLSGGKVLFTTEFGAVKDPGGALQDFAPLDSISSYTPPQLQSPPRTQTQPEIVVTSIRKNTRVNPQIAGYPLLNVDSVTVATPPTNRTLHAVTVRPIYRRADAVELYRLETDPRTVTSPASAYLGQPLIGVIRGDRKFVFLGFPLHVLNGKATGGLGAKAFLEKVFVGEFGL